MRLTLAGLRARGFEVRRGPVHLDFRQGSALLATVPLLLLDEEQDAGLAEELVPALRAVLGEASGGSGQPTGTTQGHGRESSHDAGSTIGSRDAMAAAAGVAAVTELVVGPAGADSASPVTDIIEDFGRFLTGMQALEARPSSDPSNSTGTGAAAGVAGADGKAEGGQEEQRSYRSSMGSSGTKGSRSISELANALDMSTQATALMQQPRVRAVCAACGVQLLGRLHDG